MGLNYGIYTESQLLQALRSADREASYEYTISDVNDHTIGNLDITDGVVTFDSTYAVMRTFRGSVHKSDLINLYSVDYRLVPWMCLKIGEDTVKWPLGKFLINPEEVNRGNYKTITVKGYDLGKIAEMYYEDRRIYAASGSVCTSAIGQLVGELYKNTNVIESTLRRNYANEWAVGENRLTIVNQMLAGCGYNPLWFDEYGVANATPYVLPELRGIDKMYVADETSVITDGVYRTTDIFNVPNKFVRWTESPESAYVVSTFVNDDPNSPYSTVNRGRVIVNRESVKDGIADQTMMNLYTKRSAVDTTMASEYLTFKTLNMPGHSYRDCLFVDIPQYGISGKFIETGWEMELIVGGLMSHKCSKVVTL